MSTNVNLSTESPKTEHREKDHVHSAAYFTEGEHVVDNLEHKECIGTRDYSSKNSIMKGWRGTSRDATSLDVNLPREPPYSEHSEQAQVQSASNFTERGRVIDHLLHRECWKGNSRDATSLDVNLPREEPPYSEHSEQDTGTSGYSSWEDTSRDTTILDINLTGKIPNSDQNEKGNLSTEGRFTEEDVQTSGKPPNDSIFEIPPNEVKYQGSVKKGLDLQDHRKITNNFKCLKTELYVDHLCDCFYRDGYFSDFDMEDIKAKKERYKKVDIFLRKLLRLKPEAYQLFLQYLKEAGFEHVRKKLEEPVKDQVQMWPVQGPELYRLKQCKKDILKELEPDAILDDFVEYEEVTIDEYEEIITQETRRKRAEAIYDLLLRHKERAYFVLLEALRKNGGGYLAGVLTAINDTRHASNDGLDTKNASTKKADSIRLSLFSGDTVQSPIESSEEKVEVKITLGRVKVRETTRTVPILKDSEEFELKVSFKNCTGVKRLELEIIKEMDKYDVKVSINDNLIKEEQCSVTSVNTGSIIITLKRCRPDSFQRLFGTGVQDPVLHLLQHIFLNPDIKKLLPCKGVQLDVELRCIPSKPKEKASDLDVIETHLNFLVEELDALTFLTPLKNRGVLSENEAEMVLEVIPPSRAARTKAMLMLIKEKKEEDIFISILKEKNRYVWEHITESKNKRSVVPVHSLVTSYQDIADNMTPNLVVGEGCVKEIMPLDSVTSWSREIQAKYILQQVMVRDVFTGVGLLSLLSFREQIPPDILKIRGKENVRNGDVSQKKRRAKKVMEVKITRPVVVFAAEFVFKEDKVAAVNPDYKHSISSHGALPLSSKGIKHSYQKRTITFGRALKATLKVSKPSPLTHMPRVPEKMTEEKRPKPTDVHIFTD